MFAKKPTSTSQYVNDRTPTVPRHEAQSLYDETGHASPGNMAIVPAGGAPDLGEGVVIIGKGTRIVGEITDCARLEIQGVVDGIIVADTLVILEGGSVKGKLRASCAEVHGVFNGQLEIADLLDVRSTGRVEGELAYGQLSVAMGGHISGNVTTPQAGVAIDVASVEYIVPIQQVSSVPFKTNGATAGYLTN